MKIVLDEIIPFGRKAFETLGEVVTASGRHITPDLVRDADLLITRTVTKINKDLLEGSSVRFVGTATIGTDHIDLDYLKQRGIPCASAPGCNATSVAEFVTAALYQMARKFEWNPAGKSIGIIGVGNVGSRVSQKAEAMGMKVIWNDPPKQRESGDPRYRPQEEALTADVVTLHVPLTREGQDATFHLANEGFFAKMKQKSLFINSSRGAVVDSKALSAVLDSGKLSGSIIDVWEGEPFIKPDLAEKVDIATPHIAGYSFDGRVRGLETIYHEACKVIEKESTWNPAPLMPPPDPPTLKIKQEGWRGIAEAVLGAYDILEDDRTLRWLIELPLERQREEFDRLHQDYPQRREFPAIRTILDERTASLKPTLEGLGFATKMVT